MPLGSWNTASSWKISSIVARRRTGSISPNTSWRLRSNKVDAVWDMVSLRTGSSGPLCRPISGTTGSPGVTFPRALAGGLRQSAGSCGILVVHRDGRVHEAIFADPARELDEVG